MNQLKLLSKLIKASEIISKNRKPVAEFIHLNVDYLKEKAEELKITYEELTDNIKSYLYPDSMSSKVVSIKDEYISTDKEFDIIKDKQKQLSKRIKEVLDKEQDLSKRKEIIDFVFADGVEDTHEYTMRKLYL